MNRLVQLDALRAFAVFGVILHHAIKWEVRLPLGPYSVRLFFVLSGFLITGILLHARDKGGDRDRGHTLRAFYARRFLRIFPIYYLALAVMWSLGQPEIRETIGWHLGYLSNVLSARVDDVPSSWGHLWSLSVEEQFYLVWPTLVLFLPRNRLPAAFLAAALCGPVFRVAAATFWGFRPALYLTPSFLDSLGLGAFLASIACRPEWNAFRRKFCRFALVGGLAIIAGTAALARLDTGWRLLVALNDTGPALVSVWLVNGAANGFRGRVGRLLELRALTYLGTISYGMYLLHNFVPWFCESAGLPLPPHGVARFAVLFALTTALASLSWHCFEAPLNSLKDRFPYLRPAEPEPAARPETLRPVTAGSA